MPFLTFSAGQGLRVALVLSLAAAVSLGITRFAYGMLLPPMRADLGWTYTVAGAMNTANAVGYLLGALSAPWLMRRLTFGSPACIAVGRRSLRPLCLVISVVTKRSGFKP